MTEPPPYKVRGPPDGTMHEDLENLLPRPLSDTPSGLYAGVPLQTHKKGKGGWWPLHVWITEPTPFEPWSG